MQLWFWVCSNSSSLMLLVMPVWNKSLMDTLLHSDLTDTTHDYKNTLQLGVINLLHKICLICTHLTSPRAAIASGRVRNELKMKLSYCSWNGYLGTSTPTEDVTLAMLQLLWYHTRSMAWVVYCDIIHVAWHEWSTYHGYHRCPSIQAQWQSWKHQGGLLQLYQRWSCCGLSGSPVRLASEGAVLTNAS